MKQVSRTRKRCSLANGATVAGLFCAALVLASVGSAAPQSLPQVVHARMVLATDGAHTDAPVRAAVIAEIAEGFHINAHHPSLDYLIPTELKLDPSPRISVEKLVYPEGKLKSFTFSDTQLSVYQGTIEVGALLKVERKTPPGEYALKGKFSYQACNDHACLPPASVPVSLTLRVVGKHVPLKAANREVFSKIHFD